MGAARLAGGLVGLDARGLGAHGRRSCARRGRGAPVGGYGPPSMRNPRDFAKPLALGAPDPLLEIPVTPSRMIHFFDPSNEKMAAKLPDLAPHDRHPARQPRGRGPGRPQGGRARGAGARSAARSTSAATALWTRVNSLDSPWVLDDLITLVGEIGDRLDVIMVPKVEGPWDIHYVDRLLAQLEAQARAAAADPRPRDPRDRARRRQRRGDRRRLAAHAGDELRPGRPRRLAADEDDARRRRPPRLRRARRPDPARTRTRRAPSAQQDLWHYSIGAHGRRLRGDRDPPVLRAVRRHRRRRRAARRSSAPRS